MELEVFRGFVSKLVSQPGSWPEGTLRMVILCQRILAPGVEIVLR